MFFPAWVDDLDDAAIELGRWLESLGGHIDPEPPRLRLLGEPESPLGLALDTLRVEWPWGGTVLTMRLTVDSTLRPVTYSFNFSSDDDPPLIWRFCRNRGHVDDVGSETHVHWPHQPWIEAHDEVDLAFVQDRVTAHNAAM